MRNTLTAFIAGICAALLCACAEPSVNVVDMSGSAIAAGGDSSNKSIFGSVRVPEGETMVIRNGESVYVFSGAELVIDGELRCEKGGELKIQSGGAFIVNGSVFIDGSLLAGGFADIRESGSIAGNGAVTVVHSFDDINCEGTVKTRIIPPAPVTRNGITSVGDIIIVNKTFSLPESYGSGLLPEVENALNKMRADSGFEMEIVSGFRDYDSQQRNFDYWCDKYGYDKATTLSAAPGHSEHQTGLTMDITSLETDYIETPEGLWLDRNCYKYGFIVRFPEGKENITGYIYEPWHIRYVGKSTAKLIHDSGLCLEEFLGV